MYDLYIEIEKKWSANVDSGIPPPFPICNPLISFSRPYCLTKTLSAALDRVDILDLVLTLVETLWASLHLTWYWLAVSPLHYVSVPVSLISPILLSWMNVGICQNLSCICEMIILFLPFNFYVLGMFADLHMLNHAALGWSQLDRWMVFLMFS